jgi:hypothetical protein
MYTFLIWHIFRFGERLMKCSIMFCLCAPDLKCGKFCYNLIWNKCTSMLIRIEERGKKRIWQTFIPHLCTPSLPPDMVNLFRQFLVIEWRSAPLRKLYRWIWRKLSGIFTLDVDFSKRKLSSGTGHISSSHGNGVSNAKQSKVETVLNV